MDTEIIDGNQQQPNTTVVDADAFARALVREMQGKGTQATQAQKDEIQTAIEDLRSKNFDDDFIEGQLRTALGLQAQTDRKIQEAVTRYTAEQRQKDAQNTIKRAIRQYAKEDELVKATESAIHANVIKAFNTSSDPAVRAAFNAFNAGAEADADVLEGLVDKEVDRILKAAGKEGKRQTPAIKTAGKTTPPTETQPTNRADLSEIQSSVYDAHKSLLARTPGLKPEEVEQKAMAAALRVKK